LCRALILQPLKWPLSMIGHRSAVTICVGAAILAALALQVSPARSQAVEPTRRVLLFHSFGQHFSPWNAIQASFRNELIKQSPYRIEFHDASLASGRFQTNEDQQPFIDYLRALFAGRNLDLIVAIGAPAARFMQQNRSELFPAIPLLIAGANENAIGIKGPLGANSTIVGADFDQAFPLETILQVLPRTKTIAVVHGSSPIEKFWVQNYREAVQRLSNRLTFEWLNGLSLQDLLNRVAQLPPDSAIYFTTFHVDAEGVPQDSDRVFDQLYRTANVPVFSFHDAKFGHGLVGGSMLSAKELASRTATVAVRLLQGEAPDGIKSPALGLSAPVFDWRELQRWGISERDLPSGSRVEFRESTLWERYRLQLIAVGIALIVQTLLIILLSYEHRRRRFAEAQSVARLSELAQMNRFATAGELTASIAHEIRQPLAAIAAFGSAALRWIKRDNPDLAEARIAIEKVVEESHRAGDFIKGVRGMFSKEAHVQELLDLNGLIEHVLAIMAGAIKAGDIVLDVNFSKGAPLAVAGDPTQLQQVILNLVMNAVEAMSKSRKGTRRLHIATEAGVTARAVVRVRDSGPRVDLEVADKMFEPFFTTKPGGMGMGLSICKSIIEAHGGLLTATPNNPHGMEFRIVLPTASRLAA
jgi:signal transduction histidine kinase